MRSHPNAINTNKKSILLLIGSYKCLTNLRLVQKDRKAFKRQVLSSTYTYQVIYFHTETSYLKPNMMSLSREIISHYFHVPLHQAAKHLNVSLSLFKLQCRDVGILRWPYRKLLSLQRLINQFQVSNWSILTVESLNDDNI